ncbi:MAG: hypothetical protein IJ286_02575 [Alistipes sp.]|nr:hypothetical protein [Alistipes sp.]
MISTLIYLLGVALGVYAVYEIFTKKTATEMTTKVLSALLILLTSWIGIAVYYFYLRDKLK